MTTHRLASYPLTVMRARLRGGKHTAGRSVSQSASQPASPTDTQPRCMDNRTRPVHTAARGKDDESVLGHLYALTVDRTLPVTRPAHRGGSRPEALDRGFPFPVKDTTYPDYSLLRSEERNSKFYRAIWSCCLEMEGGGRVYSNSTIEYRPAKTLGGKEGKRRRKRRKRRRRRK